MKLNLKSLKAMIPALMILGLLLFAAESSGSESAFKFGKISAKGSGCPEGTVSIIKTENKQSASLLFSEMMVEVPQFDGDNENDQRDEDNRTPTARNNEFVAHKVCNISLNADIPVGHKVTSADISIDYRGATYMDEGTQAFFHSKFLNFTGPGNREHRVRGTVVRKVWRSGEVEEDWTFSESKRIELNSNCGQSGQTKSKITLKNILKAQVKRGFRGTGAAAYLSLDSTDIVGTMKIKINTELCGGTSSGSGNRDIGRSSRQCRRGYVWSSRTRQCLPKRARSKRPRRLHRW